MEVTTIGSPVSGFVSSGVGISLVWGAGRGSVRIQPSPMTVVILSYLASRYIVGVRIQGTQ